MSMLRLLEDLRQQNANKSTVRLLYSTKAEQMQFVSELKEFHWLQEEPNRLSLFLSDKETIQEQFKKVESRRIAREDIKEALQGDLQDQLLYICGPPSMTDEFEVYALNELGFAPDRLMIEKWW